MKMTQKKSLGLSKEKKYGLSIVLAVALLGNFAPPAPALAAAPTQSALATPAVAETATTPEEEAISTVQDTLTDICRESDKIPDEMEEKCAKDLFGILMQESMGKATAVGDHGMARGWFQINRHYNPSVTVACAEELRCSAEWTLDHLVVNKYVKYQNWAIWCHNGCNINKKYVPAVKRKITLYWSTPLPVVTAEDHRALAKK